MLQQMHDEQENLAALAQQKTRTQADYYRVHDKVSQTDLRCRAVKKLVSLKATEIHKKEQEPTLWTKDEEEGWSAVSGPRWTTNFSSAVILSFVC